MDGSGEGYNFNLRGRNVPRADPYPGQRPTQDLSAFTAPDTGRQSVHSCVYSTAAENAPTSSVLTGPAAMQFIDHSLHAAYSFLTKQKPPYPHPTFFCSPVVRPIFGPEPRIPQFSRPGV